MVLLEACINFVFEINLVDGENLIVFNQFFWGVKQFWAV